MFRGLRLGAKKLAKEITLTLILKIILIFSIWYFFFSHPVDDSLTDEKVRRQILGSVQSGFHSSDFHPSTLIITSAFQGDPPWLQRV